MKESKLETELCANGYAEWKLWSDPRELHENTSSRSSSCCCSSSDPNICAFTVDFLGCVANCVTAFFRSSAWWNLSSICNCPEQKSVVLPFTESIDWLSAWVILSELALSVESVHWKLKMRESNFWSWCSNESSNRLLILQPDKDFEIWAE